MHSSIWKFVFFGLTLAWSALLPASELPAAPTTPPVLPNLRPLVARSGYVFSGTVKSIERIKPRSRDSVGVMRITFLVEHGYRGVLSGQTIAIHEWAGLWQSGQRYRVGEHVMLFLYPPSKLGLTSPVPNGKLPVDSSGNIVVPPSTPPPGSPLPRGALPPGSFRINPIDFELALRRAEQE